MKSNQLLGPNMLRRSAVLFCATSVLPSTQVVRDSTAAIASAEAPAAPWTCWTAAESRMSSSLRHRPGIRSCVAVTVHSGAGSNPFFLQVSSTIQLVDPFTDTVLRQLSGLDTLMSPNSTRTFNLGPYTHDPWTALAVTVQADLGEVLPSDVFPTSC